MPKRTVYFFLTIYNEEYALPTLVESLSRIALPENTDYRIYAVDDASTDSTPRVLKDLQARYPIDVHRYEKNQGIPVTFRDGFSHFAHTVGDDDVVILMEADGTSDPAVVPLMLEKIQAGSDMVIASRHVKGGAYVRFPRYRTLGSSLVNFTLRVLWRIPGVTDYTIFFRAYRGSLIKKVFAEPVSFFARKSFAANGELLLVCKPVQSRIDEVPLRYDYGLKKGNSRMRLFSALYEYMRITLAYQFSRS